MEAQVRFAVAQRLVAAQPGPWQAEPSVSFLESVGELAVARNAAASQLEWVLQKPDFDALWVRELVRRDEGDALVTFLARRWSDVIERPVRMENGHRVIALDDATLRFTEATDGRGEGLAGLDLVCADPARRGLVLISGIRFRLLA